MDRVWIWLGVAALLIFGLGGAYTVRNGRRHPMLAEGLTNGFVKGLLLVPLVLALILIGYWLGFAR